MRRALNKEILLQKGFFLGSKFQIGNITTYHIFYKGKRGDVLELKPKISTSPYGRRKKYLIYKYDNSTVSAARLIYGWFKGLKADEDVDHKDNNPFNNDLSNLEAMSHRDNCMKRYCDDPDLINREKLQCKWAKFCKIKRMTSDMTQEEFDLFLAKFGAKVLE